MKQLYHHYLDWEDWKNGMYDDVNYGKGERIVLAAELLKNESELHSAMIYVSENWICSAEENLTNETINRRAWLGQAACCYQCKASESETRAAWALLTNGERDKANRIAEQIIEKWQNKRNYGDYGYAYLLGY
jgi:hypothetical protein